MARAAAAFRKTLYRVRDYVFMEGDPALWSCLVKTGGVKILRHSRIGKDDHGGRLVLRDMEALRERAEGQRG